MRQQRLLDDGVGAAALGHWDWLGLGTGGGQPLKGKLGKGGKGRGSAEKGCGVHQGMEQTEHRGARGIREAAVAQKHLCETEEDV